MSPYLRGNFWKDWKSLEKNYQNNLTGRIWNQSTNRSQLHKLYDEGWNSTTLGKALYNSEQLASETILDGKQLQKLTGPQSLDP